MTLTRTNSDKKKLILLTGPTAVGKTQLSIEIAQHLGTEIISADSRQFYKDLKIGTAAPTPQELSKATHRFVGHLSLYDYYNASMFEQDALKALERIFHTSDHAILTGGSGLYLDAVCSGIDDMPDITPDIRKRVKDIYAREGLEGLRFRLKSIDPEYYNTVDLANPNRMTRGLEMFYATGEKLSDFRKSQHKERPFQIIKIILNRPRQELFERINLRTGEMVQQGIIEEAIRFFPKKHLNALNTVGYKELFFWLENRWNLHTALEKIQTNTRRYAKRQLTWFKRYPDAHWFEPSQKEEILKLIES